MALADLIKASLALGGVYALYRAAEQGGLVPPLQLQPAPVSPVPAPPQPVSRQRGGLLQQIGTSAALIEGLLGRFGGSERAVNIASGVGDFATLVSPAPVARDAPVIRDGGLFDTIAGLGETLGLGDFSTTVTPEPRSGVSGDADTVARTIWGEARGEGQSGMEAVASVIMNRVRDRRWPSSPAAVARQPFQFSAWNIGDPNRALMQSVTRDDRRFAQALDIAQRAVSGGLGERTRGATHYHATSIAPPRWTAGAQVSARIGSHVFYVGVA